MDSMADVQQESRLQVIREALESTVDHHTHTARPIGSNEWVQHAATVVYLALQDDEHTDNLLTTGGEKLQRVVELLNEIDELLDSTVGLDAWSIGIGRLSVTYESRRV